MAGASAGGGAVTGAKTAAQGKAGARPTVVDGGRPPTKGNGRDGYPRRQRSCADAPRRAAAARASTGQGTVGRAAGRRPAPSPAQRLIPAPWLIRGVATAREQRQIFSTTRSQV